jgi:glycosyltransferase involved in cell wall biosynthesis/SAM-dependent methyltransferase
MFGDLRRVTPIARRFGFDRGQPVDRYFIEQFLERNRAAIRGRVLEIGDDTYTRRFGGPEVAGSDVLHVAPGNPRATIVADLAGAPQIPSGSFDCIICTQTLQLIYDARSAVQTLFRILKPGGVVLATVPGISQIDDPVWAPSWYWSFTPLSAGRIFGDVFGQNQVDVRAHGNVLAATCFLHGLASEDINPIELEYEDAAYPFLITIKATKTGLPSDQTVSIVIPCFNQARFLSEAIESALSQTHRAVEVVVIDDGSADGTAEVAARYAEVRYVRQPNSGLAAARNAGLRHSTGRYVVFLDADDRLLVGAAAIGVDELERHPECAFVSGEHRYIGVDGSVMQEWSRPAVGANHYAALLKGNYIGMVATVMFRRDVFQTVQGFDGRWNACEDYDLYLRIARVFPIRAHTSTVAEYRRYPTAMSSDPGRMLDAALAVLSAQREAIRGHREYEQAWREGRLYWRQYYGRALADSVRRHWQATGRGRYAAREMWQLARLAPAELWQVFRRSTSP